MPMPKPRSGENKDDFVNRCMGDSTMVSEFDAAGQRFAVCLRQWESNKTSEAPNARTGS
jgi:hypothetical protein